MSDFKVKSHVVAHGTGYNYDISHLRICAVSGLRFEPGTSATEISHSTGELGLSLIGMLLILSGFMLVYDLKINLASNDRIITCSNRSAIRNLASFPFIRGEREL
jgi:hypothetical protein